MKPAMMSQLPAARRFGVRALVTRPRAEAAGLAADLAARGVEAVIEPLMDVHFRSEPAPDLIGVQAVLCTSANGVRALARLSGDRELPLFAVGDATARRAREAGFANVFSAGGDAADLARLARQRLQPDAGRLVHVAGSVVAGDLAAELRDAGFAVERLALYEARPVTALSAGCVRALDAGLIDFALFFSSRTSAVFARLVEQADIAAALRRVVAVSISAAADAPLAGLGFRGRRTAATPNQADLLAELDSLLAERRAVLS